MSLSIVRQADQYGLDTGRNPLHNSDPDPEGTAADQSSMAPSITQTAVASLAEDLSRGPRIQAGTMSRGE